MCSSPKTSHKGHNKTITLRPTQLSGQQHADFAAKANAAWERRELRRQQHQAPEITPDKTPGLLARFWQKLIRSDTRQTATRSHSTQ